MFSKHLLRSLSGKAPVMVQRVFPPRGCLSAPHDAELRSAWTPQLPRRGRLQTRLVKAQPPHVTICRCGRTSCSSSLQQVPLLF